MDRRLGRFSDGADCPPGAGGRLALGLVRCAAVPLLLLAIILMGAIYGLAGLTRTVGWVARWIRTRHLANQGCGKAVTSSR